jgi:immune inhibitor A
MSGFAKIASSKTRAHLCAVAPSPELRDRIQQQLKAFRGRAELSALSNLFSFRFPVRTGMNDGVVRPSDYLRVDSPFSLVRSASAVRVPLRGELRVAVVLVDFQDRKLSVTKEHIEALFFSTGEIPTGSVREYYNEVTKGMVQIAGDVIGPLTLPHPIGYYANQQSGMGDAAPNAQNMALDAALAADPLIDFTPFDNDGDGFVDAYVIVHAGHGAEETGNSQDIWSHKWVLPSGAIQTDQTSIFGYLTVPEDCKLGVCAHELGHLLFGFPDLYDIDNSSEGIGNWCLMAGGSWNGGGDIPAHPSAWCKVQQNWAPVVTPTGTSQISLEDVKQSGQIIHVSPLSGDKSEYFLIENRQKALFDREMPGEGLLVWHVDDRVADNTHENHPKVALLQADGRRDLENAANRGDDGDPYPGASSNVSIGAKTSPNTHLYSGVDSRVQIAQISSPGSVMTFDLNVSATITRKPRRRRKAA